MTYKLLNIRLCEELKATADLRLIDTIDHLKKASAKDALLTVDAALLQIQRLRDRIEPYTREEST